MIREGQVHPREHHFYVSIAKFLFHHPDYGIISVQDPIKRKDAEQYGLSPLILYGLTVAGLPIRWMTYSAADQPRPFLDVLLEGWHNAKGLRGHPDILRVNRHIAQASPNLARRMAEIGVQLEVAEAKEKSLPASLRSAQNASREPLDSGKDLSLAGSILTLCRDAQHEHDWHTTFAPNDGNIREAKSKVQEWLKLPAQIPALVQTGEMDWEIGPWLWSWESSLPPSLPRYLTCEGFTGRTRLATGEKAPEEIVEDDDFWTDSFCDNFAEIAKNLIACWPNSPAKIAKAAGITLRELQWFTSRKASLDSQKRWALEALLRIEYDESIGEYIGAGPYVLMAIKPKALKEIYEAITHGGNASPYEIVPYQGTADPSWRYILINTYGEPPCIVMFPRGAKITERLPDLLLNYSGIAHVSTKFYQDIVSTCARACLRPEANVQEMSVFAETYKEHWIRCTWKPS